PPTIEMKDVIRGRQVEAATSCPDRDYEHRRAVLRRERRQHLLALPGVQPAMEEADASLEPLLQVRHEPVEAGVLGEDERLVGGGHGAEQRDQPLQLA